MTTTRDLTHEGKGSCPTAPPSRPPFLSLFVAQLLGLVISYSTCAEISTDGSVGPALSLNGPDYQVTADLGQQMGGNLFHSFSTFNINAGESATFSGPNTVNNIIGRVTGGDPSHINGLLRSTIPGADLYLINPNGVLFGDNASLDVGGSLYVSTADYLKLGDSGRFDASDPSNTVLTTAPPSAFGILGSDPASLNVQDSVLQVPDGKELSLVGGDIEIVDGNLYAPDGRVALASVAHQARCRWTWRTCTPVTLSQWETSVCPTHRANFRLSGWGKSATWM